ncbi:MAG: DUF3581 domain-containing protein [Thiotrichales bacterium]|nr:DUF3581 domain-containing protein [Thiotrichales bacterium]
MYLNPFHQTENGFVSIQPEQASRFAKEVAQDFNPLHNPDSKRFCVPGDLLFALVLSKTGLSSKMVFNYTGMVGKDVLLNFPTDAGSEFNITDNQNKKYLDVTREGETSTDLAMIESFTRAYVAFSGHSFPHILVPLMQEHNVMINPERPMVIYESMAFEFDRLDLQAPTLEFANSELAVNGKRGTVTLHFNVIDNSKIVGKGCKTMVLSGLREFHGEQVQGLVDAYEATKASYQSA